MESADVQEQAILASIQALVARLSAPKPVQESNNASAAAAIKPTEMRSRLIVVANRLPISVTKDAAGAYQFKMSSGGLVSALVSVRDRLRFIWIGWLGKEIPEEDQPLIRKRLMKEYNCLPVFISDALAEAYYNGFSNDILWPLFHYEQNPVGTKKFDFELWNAYKKANARFADVIFAVQRPDDYIWVHDYHLMVLPHMLRKKLREATIAWFLHTPWPSSEVYRVLPVRSEILRGLLACDLIGFHTYDYARHFLSSCVRVLKGTELTPSSILYHGRSVQVGVYPIGIEPQGFVSTLNKPECKSRIEALCAQFEGMRVVVAVDRLDPIKGIPHRLLGLETLFKKHPEWIGKVVFLQVAVPSRADVAAYQRLTAQVNQLVGSINGQFGTLSYQPVHYMYRSVDPTELCALYNIGDVALITSLRDGMNLVSEEYVACHVEPCRIRAAPGALVLSEFAGCAQSLAGAIRVNPWSPDDVAEGLHSALTLSPLERRLRWEKLYQYVTKYTSQYWASAFVSAMQDAAAIASARLKQAAEAKLQPLPAGKVVAAQRKACHRIMILQYESAMVAQQLVADDLSDSDEASAHDYNVSPILPSQPGSAISFPDVGRPPPTHLVRILRDLASDDQNVVVVVSSKSMEKLEEWFGSIPRLRLVAENGMLIRLPVHCSSWRSEDSHMLSPSMASLGRYSMSPRTPVGISQMHATVGGTAEKYRPKLSDVFGPERPAIAADVQPQEDGSHVQGASAGKQDMLASWWSVSSTIAGAPVREDRNLFLVAQRASQFKAGHVELDGFDSARPDEGRQQAVPQWKGVATSIVHHFAQRTPGSWVYETPNILQWSYEHADPDLGSWQAKELQIVLEASLAAYPVTVRICRKVLEIRNRDGSMESALLAILDDHDHMRQPFDFVLVICDDHDSASICSTVVRLGDEQELVDLRNAPVKLVEADALASAVYLISCGHLDRKSSISARFAVDTPADVRSLLLQLSH